jgi:predicted phage tail protein
VTATTIRLSGPLGKRFGRTFRLHLDTKTPAEAVRALCAMLDGFKAYLSSAADRGVEFAIFRGRGEHEENIGYEQLREPGGADIRIAQVHAGAKNGGVLQTVVGAVLVVIGLAISGWSFGTLTPLGSVFVSVGVGMIAGGVVQMLSPQPKLNKAADSADNQASDIFNGPVNTTAQGGAVPLIYGGPIEVGSVVLSGGIEAVDYSARPSNVDAGSPDGNSKTSPYDPIS